jgi:hypothetical protein
MATPESNVTERAAQRAKGHPSFVGYALSLYQQSRGQSEAELAGWLGCPIDTMSRLSLCRRPVGTDAAFRFDVEAIARFAGIDAERLVQVLRTAEGIEAFRSVPAAGDADSRPLRFAARQAGKAGSDEVAGGGKGEGS